MLDDGKRGIAWKAREWPGLDRIGYGWMDGCYGLGKGISETVHNDVYESPSQDRECVHDRLIFYVINVHNAIMLFNLPCPTLVM